jgi:hypothetical protein
MSCCGEQRQQLRNERRNQQAPGSKAVNGHVIFEYTGPTGVVVKGVVSGRGYRFVGYGARVAVDARDASSLTKMPYLQRVLR